VCKTQSCFRSFLRTRDAAAADDAETEADKYDQYDEKAQNVYYVPLLWACDLVNKTYEEKLIKDKFALKTLLKVHLLHRFIHHNY